jgi:hypothetical protein
VEATASVVSSRNASGRILAEVKKRAPDAVVMAAPPPRHWLIAHLFWEQEPYRVRRLSHTPVYIVVADPAAKGTQTASPRNGAKGAAV